jgi:photosystem II stability/assembly factor-like uncharacterized protein
MKKTLKLVPVVFALFLFGQGCPIQLVNSSAADGGIFRSADGGANWLMKDAVLSTAGGKTLAQADIIAIAADPEDSATIYVGTTANGLLYTTDGGDSWFAPPILATAKINAIAVHPKDKCTVYAVSGNAVIKTTDCARSWAKIFEDSRSDVVFNTIKIDSFNPSVLYLGSNKGDVIKSTDEGASWTTVKVLGSSIAALPVDPFDSRIIYAATRSSGVWKSTDGGANWTDVTNDINNQDGAKDIFALYPDLSRRDAYVAVSTFGLMRTADGGAHWDVIRLLTPAGQARIYGLAMNPQNGLEIYYATATIFYKSSDGGAHWTTKRLPTSRVGNVLLVDAKNQNLIYLGTLKLKK